MHSLVPYWNHVVPCKVVVTDDLLKKPFEITSSINRILHRYDIVISLICYCNYSFTKTLVLRISQ